MTTLTLARLSICGIAIALTACRGGDDPTTTRVKTVVTPYLNVSVSEFYFGTQDVGTTATQTIELSNRSGDLYPINDLLLDGLNADEFALNFNGAITLKPSEKVAIDVSFSPLSGGLKNADLKVNYDIISQATEVDNLNEQLFYDARSLENARDYDLSLRRYRSYLNSDPVTANKSKAAIKLPVLIESQNYGEGADFDHFVSALNYREDGATDNALNSLDELLQDYPDSYLADDAQYMKGYIQLIDNENYSAAEQNMVRLQEKHPQSTYLDTALYSEAIALEEQGELLEAANKYRKLLDRHRSGTWAVLSLNLAKDNFTSRMWFARANKGLDRVAG